MNKTFQLKHLDKTQHNRTKSFDYYTVDQQSKKFLKQYKKQNTYIDNLIEEKLNSKKRIKSVMKGSPLNVNPFNDLLNLYNAEKVYQHQKAQEQKKMHTIKVQNESKIQLFDF